MAICACLVLLVAAIYVRTARFDFISVDDTSYVRRNVHVNTGLSCDNVAWSLTASHAGNWHPLTWMSHMLDVTVFGMNPGAHHMVNALFHAANAVLLFLLLVALTGSTWRSGLVAALFAVHPLNVESVAWIAERKSVLSTFFWLLTTLAYVAYARRGDPTRGRAMWYALVLILFALGLMAKPMLVTLPLTLLLLDYWPLRRQLPLRDLLIEKIPMIAMVLAACMITLVVQQAGGMTRPLAQFPAGVRLANALVAYVAYLVKMVWPAGLCMLYPHPGRTLPAWQPVASAIALAAVTILVIRLRRRAPYLAFGWLWYLITLVPVIGLVQVGPQAMADRYAYVPLIGVFIAITWGAGELAGKYVRRPMVLAVPALAVLAALSVSAYHQVGYWRDTSAVFRRTLAITRNNLPVACSFVGSMWRADMMPEAITVIEGTRSPVGMFNGIGVLLARVGVFEPAETMYGQALRIEPRYAEAHANLGIALAKQQRYEEAVVELRRAVALKPDNVIAHHSLGVALYELGRTQEAIAEWRKALRIDPGFEPSKSRLRQTELSGESF